MKRPEVETELDCYEDRRESRCEVETIVEKIVVDDSNADAGDTENCPRR